MFRAFLLPRLAVSRLAASSTTLSLNVDLSCELRIPYEVDLAIRMFGLVRDHPSKLYSLYFRILGPNR
jgi:hypothetical protein